jgi:small-conductance mechanosensitive channel/CRP-like cAMP-binding protein
VNQTLNRVLGATSFGGVGLVVLLVLLLALVGLLPATARPRLRGPLMLLGVHLVFVSFVALLPHEAAASRPLGLVAVFVLLTAIARCLFLLAIDSVLGNRLGGPLPKIFRDIIQAFIYAAVVFLTLQAAGVEPGSLLTTSALLTAVIGLSLQDTLGNLFAGLSIQAQRPFEVGDWIQFDPDAKLIGRVVEINWRATKVLTNDEVEIIIPNATLAKAPIRNFTKPTAVARRTVEVICAYDVAPARVREVILGSLEGLTSVKEQPAPSVLLAAFDESGMRFQLRYYMENFQARDPTDSAVRERVWYALRRAGVTIPYPTREVRVITGNEPPRQPPETLQRRLRGLRGVDVLAVLPEPDLARLAAQAESRVYAPDELIIRQGDAGEELFIVERGEVRVIVGRAGGSSAELAKLSVGKFFGEMSLLTGERRSATVQAAGECELLVVHRQVLQQFMAASPQLAERMGELLMTRQEQLDEHLASRSARPRQNPEERKQALISKIRQYFDL